MAAIREADWRDAKREPPTQMVVVWVDTGVDMRPMYWRSSARGPLWIDTTTGYVWHDVTRWLPMEADRPEMSAEEKERRDRLLELSGRIDALAREGTLMMMDCPETQHVADFLKLLTDARNKVQRANVAYARLAAPRPKFL